MAAKAIRIVALATSLILWSLIMDGCSHDEESLTQSGPQAELIGLTYENPIEIEVNSSRHLALLLHDSSSSRGSAIQLVDVGQKSVVATLILVDYSNVYDIRFVNDHEACFAGHRIPGGGYAVGFVSLPNLTLGPTVVVDSTGSHGYLAVDSAAGAVHYSHAGGGNHDAVYKIAAASHQLVDADADNQPPYGLDNNLVSGLFNQPARMVFDHTTGRLSVANLGDDYMTVLDSTLWGHLTRGTGYTFPGLAGTTRVSTLSGGVSPVRPEAMNGANGYDVFAGTANGTAYLGRFGTDPVGLYALQTLPGRTWRHLNGNIRVHPRADVVSVFILQRDSIKVGIGQYGLNSFPASAPYYTRTIPDSAISTFGLDVTSDLLIVGDAHAARLELINIRSR